MADKIIPGSFKILKEYCEEGRFKIVKQTMQFENKDPWVGYKITTFYHNKQGEKVQGKGGLTFRPHQDECTHIMSLLTTFKAMLDDEQNQSVQGEEAF